MSVELLSDLKAINFNLEGREDNWKEKLQLLQSYIDSNNDLPNAKSSLFNWGEKQFKRLESLSTHQQKEFKACSFIPLYQKKKDIWGGHFKDLTQFKAQLSILPTVKTNPKVICKQSHYSKIIEALQAENCHIIQLSHFIKAQYFVLPDFLPRYLWDNQLKLEFESYILKNFPEIEHRKF